jgi:hypothetical protein
MSDFDMTSSDLLVTPAGAPPVTSVAPVVLPPTFGAAVRGDLARAFRPPYEIPSVLLMNAALVTGSWFLLPRAWLFKDTASAWFPVALAVWMYADVPATNVLAPIRLLALAAIKNSPGQDGQVLRLRRARVLTLWALITPPALIVAVITGLGQRDHMLTAASLVAIAVVPFGMLAPASCLGVRWPYHPRAMRWRWQQARTDRRGILRYTVLVLLPYSLVPATAWLTLLPAMGVWRLMGYLLPLRPIPYGRFAVLAALTMATSAALWVYGRRLALSIVGRHREQLIAYLADPDRG